MALMCHKVLPFFEILKRKFLLYQFIFWKIKKKLEKGFSNMSHEWTVDDSNAAIWQQAICNIAASSRPIGILSYNL